MSRTTVEMQPTPIELSMIRELERFADVLLPGDAVTPILAPGVRSALFEWMTEIRAADVLATVGLRPRHTALLYGPPGTGKTTFAHHFASRLGLPLACIRSESVIDCLLGSTGRNIGQLFDAMTRTEGKVVIFLDEVDALGGKRMNDQGASVERSNSLNVLLRRIERFAGICLAATNRPDALDAALWRRFDMQISIDLPGAEERFAILRRYACPFVVSDDDLDLLVDLTSGASPALLRMLMEGVKRAIVLWPRVNRSIEDPVQIFRSVTASVAPAPEIEPPLLWSDARSCEILTRLHWPPELSGDGH